jgi:LysM repeat protein
MTVLILALAACSGGQGVTPTGTPQVVETAIPTAEPQKVEVLAPIEHAEILVAESFPPQYFLWVQSGLPNGCAEFDRYEVNRDADTIRVAVFNLEVKGVPCTEIYRTVEHTIPLGSDFEPGREYTVWVNDVSTAFVAQGPTPTPDVVSAALSSPFQLKVGQSALVEPQGPIVEFIEVVEDSRCAIGVVCIQAGRARILVRVSSSGDVLGFGIQDLVLEAGRTDVANDCVEGVSDSYLLELLALEPYPRATDENAPATPVDYTATIVVTRLEAHPTPAATHTLCAVRSDWFAYTVVHGDTLFNIAQRANSSVDELLAANCLHDATQVLAGQTLYLPNPVAMQFVKFYLILEGDNGQSGPAVGCGDSAVAVWRDRAATGSLPDDIQASLEELLSIGTQEHGQSGYSHSLHDADLTVQGVAVSGDAAQINLTGTLQLLGVCADARMEAQILLTLFQYPGFDSATITINGTNMKQWFDASGTVGDDEPYRRSEVQF